MMGEKRIVMLSDQIQVRGGSLRRLIRSFDSLYISLHHFFDEFPFFRVAVVFYLLILHGW